MGTGKSSAAITYMNEHPDRKFIYITPYLDEAARIAVCCPELHFQEPRRVAELHGSKTEHTAELVHEGCNIASTHSAFKFYTPDLLDEIRRRRYTLIIDENVDVLESLNKGQDDIQVLIDSGRLKEKAPGVYGIGDVPYGSGENDDLFRMLKSRDIVKLSDPDNEALDGLFFWRFPPELIAAFDDVFILTYMFRGQNLRYFLDMCHIPYSYMGVSVDGDTFRFCEGPSYIPTYVRHIREHIHILDNPRMNAVGESRTALSMSWYQRGGKGVDDLKKNLNNYYRHIAMVDTSQRMWGSYATAEYKLRGKGYARGFVVFNEKATNKYRERTALAYCANVFMNVGHKLFYRSLGVEVDEDEYALSVMVQWIWRSAIRDGRDVQLYIPSKRMRNLLADWMDGLAQQGPACPGKE